jgi:DNA-binding NtrC family response regulator
MTPPHDRESSIPGPDAGATASELTLATREVYAAQLEIVQGPGAGTKRRLEEPSLLVGTGALCELRLSDPKVSREHLQIELTTTGVVVRDRGSKNGTWLGAVQLRDAVFIGDASLRLGSTVLQLTVDAKPTAIVVSREESFGRAYARSLPMRHLFASLGRAAESELSILLEGESGVGKEVLARAIHERSPRAARPFIAIDCGAIPRDLVESELFGHERGAFTGADRARLGLFQQANGGTVFLDELGELPIDLQPRLLRVLQEREVRPVGSNRAQPIEIRVLAATNKNLKDACAAKTFREDLFYRVAQLRLRVPSLRERTDDIGPLATRFLRDVTSDPEAELPPDILSMLATYSWPGNVRELKNVVSRIAFLEAKNRRDLFDVTSSLHTTQVPSAEDLSTLPYHDARQLVLDRLDSSYFAAVLRRAGGVRARAMELSGMSRSSFYRMLERLGAVLADGDKD